MAAISIVKLADRMGVTKERLREFSRREEDPLPIRLLPGAERGMFINDKEWEEWSERNCPLVYDLPSRR